MSSENVTRIRPDVSDTPGARTVTFSTAQVDDLHLTLKGAYALVDVIYTAAAGDSLDNLNDPSTVLHVAMEKLERAMELLRSDPA